MFVIKDYKKKQTWENYRADVANKISDMRRHYDEVKREARELEKRRLEQMGLHGVKSFEIKKPEEFHALEETMRVLGERNSEEIQKLFKQITPLASVDETGQVKKV